MTSLNVSKRLTETVTVKRPTSHSSSGDPVFGAPFTCAARVERLEGDAGDAGGRKRTDSTKLITTTELKAGDVVWLPEDNTAQVSAGRKILTVKQNRAIDGSIVSYSSTV
jgi:hypothetical protein